MRFTKMHGQGNDFVVIGPGASEARDLVSLSTEMCHRQMGVGGDGLIAILPSDKADFRMRIFNADGSEPEMCGNGVRCAAKYYVEKVMPSEKGATADGNVKISVETLAGIRIITAACKDGKVDTLTVDMGAPILHPPLIPVSTDQDNATALPVVVGGQSLRVTCVSMGNPHAVVFVDSNPFDMDISVIGPALERHEMFPRRTNVEFVQVLSENEMRMRVWERGCGETLACGTGACATLVASSLNNMASRSAVIHLRGGDLHIDWDEKTGAMFMTGGAVSVFEGEWLA